MKWSAAANEKDLAGFDVLVTTLNPEVVEIAQSAEIVYREIRARGLRTLFDDRSGPAAGKLADALGLGVPIQINVGADGLSRGVVDLVVAQTAKTHQVPLEEIADKTLEVVRELKRK